MRKQSTDRPRGPKAKLLIVELAGRPNERRLYAQILAVIGAPQNPRATIVELERTADPPSWRPRCASPGPG